MVESATYANLGRTGLRVPRLCLGTMTFGLPGEESFMHGSACDESVAFRIMDRAFEAGLYFLDTADIYGGDGGSERIIGRWQQARGNRDDLVVATKFRFRTRPGENGDGCSRYHIRHAVDASLRRLQTDRIDLLQVHAQDLRTPEDELLRALDDLVRQGKVLYIGCSNYTAYRLLESLTTSLHRGLERYASVQMQYNLIVRDIEREHVPIIRDHEVGLLTWSPLARGFLTGKFRPDRPPPKGTRLQRRGERWGGYDSERHRRVLAAVDAIVAQTGATHSQVALAWLLHKPWVCSVIFGARTVEQLDENLGAWELSLTPEQLATLDDASAFDPGYPYSFLLRTQPHW